MVVISLPIYSSSIITSSLFDVRTHFLFGSVYLCLRVIQHWYTHRCIALHCIALLLRWCIVHLTEFYRVTLHSEFIYGSAILYLSGLINSYQITITTLAKWLLGNDDIPPLYWWRWWSANEIRSSLYTYSALLTYQPSILPGTIRTISRFPDGCNA